MRNQMYRHTAPAAMQECPIDNTSAFVSMQASVWAGSNLLIHTEIAQEIAADWADPSNAMAVFATTGRLLHDSILGELTEYMRLPDMGWQSVRELAALRAYVLASREVAGA